MLSLQDKALFIAKKAQEKHEEAEAISKFWLTDLKAEYPAVTVNQKKIDEETKQLNKIKE